MLIARKEAVLVLARLKGKRLYLGVLAALLAAGVAAVIPYLYGRLTDLAISSPGAVREMISLILIWLLLSFLNQGLTRFSNRQA